MFGRYELLDRIGLGGMAEVWRAKVGGVGGFEKIVVIKKILPSFASNKTFIDMLLAEARLCAVLQHANIVQTYENGEIDGIFYIAMEYVRGHDLFKVLSRATQTQMRIPPELCLYIAAETAKGLHYAHFAKDHYGRPLNIIHRDVSPSNILLAEGGEVKVMDFGVAKASSGDRDNATRSGVLKGKLGYMSPEQVTGRAFDHRSDIFSLGIILYESLTLKRLFLAKTDLETLVNIRDARIEHKFKKHSYIDEDIRNILRRALARDPNERYATAMAMHDDIMKVMFERRQHVATGQMATYLEALFTGDEHSVPVLTRDSAPAPAGDEPPPIPDEEPPKRTPAQARARSSGHPQPGTPAAPTAVASLSFSPEEMQRIRARIAETRAQSGLPPLPVDSGELARPTVPQVAHAEAPRREAASDSTPVDGTAVANSARDTAAQDSGAHEAVSAPSASGAAIRHGTTPSRSRLRSLDDRAMRANTGELSVAAMPEGSTGQRRAVDIAIAAPPATNPQARSLAARAMRPEFQTAPFPLVDEGEQAGNKSGTVSVASELSSPVSSTEGTLSATPEPAPSPEQLSPADIPVFQPVSASAYEIVPDFVKQRLGAEPVRTTAEVPQMVAADAAGAPSSTARSTHATHSLQRSQSTDNATDTVRASTPVTPYYRLKLANGTEMSGLTLPTLEAMLRAKTATADDVVAHGNGPFLPIRSLTSLSTVAENSSEPPKAPTLSGPLSQWVFVRLLYKMFADRATGCLEMHRGDAAKSIYFRRGRTQYITSNQHQELLGPFMVANGYISQADVDLAIARSLATGTKLGDLLLGMNLIKPFQLYQVLERQTQARFIDAFGWDSGTYAFYDGVEPPSDIVPLDFDPIAVLAEGVRERVSLAALDPLFQDKLDRPLYQRHNSLISLSDLKLQARESKAVTMLLAGKAPRQAYEECYGNRPQRLALLHVLFLMLQTELVTFDADRAG
ncbi:MAG: protein kinase [Deltaproteobacteria bacterium]|nr:protein kinase [Deltaproteobacteria bacterium]